MKKKYLFIVLMIVIIVSLFGIDIYQKNIIRTFDGYIYNYDDQVTLIDDNGSIYNFNIDKELINSGDTGLMIGNKAHLEYKGQIQTNYIEQDIEVIKLEVYDYEAYKKDDVVSDETLALQYLNNMTLSQKVGQMFFVLVDENTAIDEIIEYDLGGVLLFYKDFKDKTKLEVIDMINNYQNVSMIPMFIGVDEEGGDVNRVSLNEELCEEPFKSPSELFNEGGFDLIISDTYNKINLLKELGININFAPVADISLNENNYIHNRTFKADANKTAAYIKIVSSIMSENHFGSVLKHFPGYGDNIDTHSEIAIDNRDLNSFYNTDFKPFIEGIKANATMVLMSHNIIKNVEDVPASLSIKMHEILRNDLNFDGIIITDDLAMKGIMNLYGEKEAAIRAIKAKNDMICTTDYREMIDAVIEAINDGEIDVELIDEAVLRILNMKIDLGIIH